MDLDRAVGAAELHGDAPVARTARQAAEDLRLARRQAPAASGACDAPEDLTSRRACDDEIVMGLAGRDARDLEALRIEACGGADRRSSGSISLEQRPCRGVRVQDRAPLRDDECGRRQEFEYG